MRPGVFAARDVVADSHCLTPRFLSEQLDRSRANLGVETIDVYYVHNPETQLTAVDRPTFLGRMRAAFQLLEAAVGEGKIRSYGTATWNGYRQPPTAGTSCHSPSSSASRGRSRAIGTTSAPCSSPTTSR